MKWTLMKKLAVVVALVLLVPAITFGADFQVDVRIQRAKYIPAISQYWDSNTDVPPWVQENQDQFEEDGSWGRVLGSWDDIASGLSQDGSGAVTFVQTRNICGEDILDAIQSEVMSTIAGLAGQNFLVSARVRSLTLQAARGNFNFVTSSENSIVLLTYPDISYPFTGELNDDGSELTLTPTGVAPDVAMLFNTDLEDRDCATNTVTVVGSIPTTEVRFDVVMNLDVKTGINTQPTDVDIATEILLQFQAADIDGDGLLSFGEAMAIWPGLTQEQFDQLDRDGDGYLSEEELQATIDGEDDRCGCCRRTKNAKDIFRHHLGDWLLVGLSFLVMVALINRRQ